jgi:GTP-binding protein LepA
LTTTRNFCIVAHIDHGKSTLADRLLELTGAVAKRDLVAQHLDSNSIERERGITIKAKAVAMRHAEGGVEYGLNLIDTPGHVDFSYEVSRSLAACEGAVLLVDATQGVQAQTLANAWLAIEGGLEIVPVINKVDLPSAQTEEVREEMGRLLGFKADEILTVSGKTGLGVETLLTEIIRRVPAPKGDPEAPLQALLFDSLYDDYRGVVVYVRIVNGRLKKGDAIRFLGTGKSFQVEEVGTLRPRPVPGPVLAAGDVGYVICGIKSVRDVRIGDTIAREGSEGVAALPGYLEPLPVVFCGFYPAGETDYTKLKTALERLSLNDASFVYQPETSEALGFGFRCGFLGLLHMDIIAERLERELGVEVLKTAPNVTYELIIQRGHGAEMLRVDNPAKIPDDVSIQEFREPTARVTLIVPHDNVGSIMQLCTDRRGTFVKTEYLSPTRVILTFDMPFAEIIYDFYDKLKSATRGYGTMDYTLTGYRADDLVKLKILVMNEEVDALSTVVHRASANHKGRKIIQILRKEIARHLFQIPLQAAIGGKIVAREDIKPVGKNVTAKCYGGDITRKRKLLEKQKEGKKRMRAVASVEIPQSAFMAVLRVDE